MTPEEFTKAMQKIQDDQGPDTETLHGDMDDLMLRLLSELGYGDGVKIFESDTKWYA